MEMNVEDEINTVNDQKVSPDSTEIIDVGTNDNIAMNIDENANHVKQSNSTLLRRSSSLSLLQNSFDERNMTSPKGDDVTDNKCIRKFKVYVTIGTPINNRANTIFGDVQKLKKLHNCAHSAPPSACTSPTKGKSAK